MGKNRKTEKPEQQERKNQFEHLTNNVYLYFLLFGLSIMFDRMLINNVVSLSLKFNTFFGVISSIFVDCVSKTVTNVCTPRYQSTDLSLLNL